MMGGFRAKSKAFQLYQLRCLSCFWKANSRRKRVFRRSSRHGQQMTKLGINVIAFGQSGGDFGAEDLAILAA